MSKVGVLTLQGDFNRHIAAVRALGYQVRSIRSVADLAGVDGLIIPGGESTTIGMLMERSFLSQEVASRGDAFPILGTCAGAILLAKEIEGSDQFRLGAMDISIKRNAYGRQVDSFEADVSVTEPDFGRYLGSESLHGVFIRAPIITSTFGSARILAEYAGNPVVVRDGSRLAATFHPELAADLRIHRYFLEEVARLAP